MVEYVTYVTAFYYSGIEPQVETYRPYWPPVDPPYQPRPSNRLPKTPVQVLPTRPGLIQCAMNELVPVWHRHLWKRPKNRGKLVSMKFCLGLHWW